MTTSPQQPASGFPLVRRGYDPAAVDRYVSEIRSDLTLELEQAKADMALMKTELEEARRREEAVHLTLVAATKTKDEMLEQAERALGEARTLAKEESARILSEAQYEAFRIVTEAREEAESALTEARRDAEILRTDAADEGASLGALRAAELARLEEETAAEEAERRARLDRMRTVTEELEQRLQLLARGALEELGSIDRAVRVETHALDDMAGTIPPAATAAGARRLDSDRQEERRDDAIPLAGIAADEPGRGSFYSRRSARLPRIGDTANDALAAISAMRGSPREPHDEDIAMRTA